MDTQELLAKLGHKDAKSFQRHTGLVADGIVGPKTLKELSKREAALGRVPAGFTRCHPWRNTGYVLAEEAHYGGGKVPVYAANGSILMSTSAGFFSELALEGSGITTSGKYLNVAGVTVPVKHEDYVPVLNQYLGYRDRMQKKGREPKPSTYFGIVLGQEGRVLRASSFRIVPPEQLGKGYGNMRRRNPIDGKVYDIALEPWRTLAADIGVMVTSEPKFKGKGGVVPVGTEVWILEFDGLKVGDRVHDGHFVVNDCGGGIFGCHFDVFAGKRSILGSIDFPERVHVWYKGVEAICPLGYDYGLFDR